MSSASSLSDTQPVFDAIVQSGVRLFSGAAISIALTDGDEVRAAAIAESDPARAEAWRRRFPFPLTRAYIHSTAILDRRMLDISDVENAPAEMAAGKHNFLASGYRAMTIMPMMRGDVAIGALSVVRREPGALSDKQIAAARDLRRPGRHRHREHAAARRAAGSAPTISPNRCSSRPRPPTCSRSSAARRSTCRPCSTRWSSRRRGCATPTRAAIRRRQDGAYQHVASHGFSPEHRRMHAETVRSRRIADVGRRPRAARRQDRSHPRRRGRSGLHVGTRCSRAANSAPCSACRCCAKGTPIGVIAF